MGHQGLGLSGLGMGLSTMGRGISGSFADTGTWTANSATLQPLDSNLVAYWKLEDLTDSVGSMTMTNNGSATFTAGKNNNALTISGSQYLSHLDTDTVNLAGNDFAISAWSKITTLVGYHIIAGQSTTGNEGWILYHFNTGDGKNWIRFQYSVDGSTDRLVDRQITMSADTYYNFVVTRNGADLDIYFNSVKQGASYNISTDVIYNSTAPFTIGADGAGGANHGGQIDELGIWKGQGMNQTQVDALYNSGTGAFYTYPDTWTANSETLGVKDGYQVAYWKMEDTSDSVGSNTLTNNGSVTFVSGKNNNSSLYDANTKYLTLSNNSDYQFGTGDFTVAFWVYIDNHVTGSNSTDIFISCYQNATTGWTIGIFTATEKLYCAVAGDNQQIDVSDALVLDQWQHICMSRVGTTLSFYVDAVSKGSITDSTNITSSSDLHFGNSVGGGTLALEGNLDEVGIWKGHGMSLSEVQALYNSTAGAFLK